MLFEIKKSSSFISQTVLSRGSFEDYVNLTDSPLPLITSICFHNVNMDDWFTPSIDNMYLLPYITSHSRKILRENYETIWHWSSSLLLQMSVSKFTSFPQMPLSNSRTKHVYVIFAQVNGQSMSLFTIGCAN